jgi:S-adenosylmethionine:tRNA ribosyltransferase-isomerase
MRTAEFDFSLPPELIAQQPASQRDAARLLVLDRATGDLGHRLFSDLPGLLRAGDVLVLNDSAVIPARLRARNIRTDGRFEVLLTEENQTNDWWAMLRPGKRARLGATLGLLDHTGQPTSIQATVTEFNAEGQRRLRFEGTADLRADLARLGETPLPPYITRPAGASPADQERYQTVFAHAAGSVAAPTAGLHFTDELLQRIRAAGVEVGFVTLHVGLGTFAPVKSEQVEGHQMHEEYFELSAQTAGVVNAAKREGRRVLAVGTTSVRVLESAAAGAGVVAGRGRTRIFIHPPFDFRIVDALVTNFHWPRSTLLMLVSAFAAPGPTRGRELVLAAYAVAVRERYRFFSFGDAMFIS